MKLSKSEQDVVSQINGAKRIAKRTKHHDNAIEKLTAKGIIYKDRNNILRMMETEGIDLPTQTALTKRWITAVWKTHAGSKSTAYVAYGDSRAESMDRADILVDLIREGKL